MGLVERENELAMLEKLIADCQPGRGKTALVSGAAMTGKTALLHEFALRVHQSQAIILSASASPAEQAMPLGVLSQLFCDFSLAADDAARLTCLLAQDEALRPVLNAPDGHLPGQTMAPVARGLWKVIRELAAERPVVICIDDVHCADIPSLQGLMYFVRRIDRTRISVVLTERARSQPAYPALWAEFMRHPGHLNIHLSPLSPAGVTAMLTEQLGAESARRLASAFSHASGGNPLLIRALLDDGRLSGVAGPAWPTWPTGPAGPAGPEPQAALVVAGDNFGQAVRSCLYRFDSTVANVARGVAILADSASPSLVARLFELPPGVVAAGMETLSLAGILDAGAYRHDGARAAVLDGLAPEDRAALHNRTARLLHDAGAAARTVATHLTAGAPVDETWVIGVLQEAAEQALSEDQVSRSVRLLQTAHQACRDDGDRVIVSKALARAEWRIDPLAVRRHLPELMSAARNELLAAPDLSTMTGYLLWHGRPDEAAETLDRLSAGLEAEDGDDDSLRQLLGQIYPGVSRRERVQDPKDRSLAAAERAASELAAAELAAAERMLQETRLDDSTLMPIVVALNALVHANLLDDAASWCTILSTEASARNTPLWQAVFGAVHAMIGVQRGELAVATQRAREAFTILPAKSWGVLLGMPLASMILGTTWMGGGQEEVQAFLRIPVPEAMFETPFGLHYLQARGRFNLETSRFHAALSDFRACGELMDSWDLNTPALVPWRIGMAEAYLGLGKNAEARDMAENQLARLAPGDVRTRGIALRSMAATAELRKRPVLLTEAADLLQRCGNWLELALTFADLSQTYQALNRYSQARMLARRAGRLAQQCGAEALRRRVLPDQEPEPDPAIQQAADPSVKLSNSELRVAALAADGYTNRQISRRLYVTVSTVEQHLTRAYRKLGVNSRDDLAPAFQADIINPAAFLSDRRSTAAMP